VLVTDEVKVTDAVLELTGGDGAHMVVDLAPGAPSTVEDAVAMTTKRGRVVLASSKHGRTVSGFPHDVVVRKEITMMGVRGHDHRSVEPAIDVIRSGRYPLDLLCTHRFSLDDVHDALRVAGARIDPGAIHVSVLPNGDPG
jgi:threonine dehydrogenase-like Zn-dependent dehydrogenase